MYRLYDVCSSLKSNMLIKSNNNNRSVSELHEQWVLSRAAMVKINEN